MTSGIFFVGGKAMATAGFERSITAKAEVGFPAPRQEPVKRGIIGNLLHGLGWVCRKASDLLGRASAGLESAEEGYSRIRPMVITTLADLAATALVKGEEALEVTARAGKVVLRVAAVAAVVTLVTAGAVWKAVKGAIGLVVAILVFLGTFLLGAALAALKTVLGGFMATQRFLADAWSFRAGIIAEGKEE